MISIKNKFKTSAFAALAAITIFSACNKAPEEILGAAPIVPSGLTIAATLAANPSDSLFNKIIVKAGMVTALSNVTSSYTLFVPDNAAVIASFGGSLASANATIAALPATSLALIVKYNMIPQSLPTSKIIHPFPNLQMPTDIILDPTNPLVRMTSFPSKSGATGTTFYYNNAPLTAVDAVVANGIIHHTAFVVSPPSRVLKDTIARVSNLSYFRAAIARADSGQVGLGKLDSLLNYPVVNMTVLAPNDAAFQTLVFGLAFKSYLASRPQPYTATDTAIATATGNGAVAAGPVFLSTNNVTTAQVKGIMAYHFLAKDVSTNPAIPVFQPVYRAFSVNFPATPIFVKTLVNAGVAVHPGILAKATYAGPFVSALTFSSYGSLISFPVQPPFSYTANTVGIDRLAVNGIFHIIDKVLLPQ
ncbi:MAG: fasciclin domain-containing protein [Ferruginibacter sp.]